MKKLINEIHTEESGQIVGRIVNLVIAVTGAMFCIYGVYLQIIHNL